MTVRWNAKPTLRRPALVAAFSGWNDAADAASDGVRWLARSVGARVFATLDTEEYLDFQAARPTVELVDGVIREIQWPALAFSAGSAPAGGRDLVLLLGVEPNLRWPTFCDDVISVARATGLRDGRDARRAARRRAPLATDACHRIGDRRGARGAARDGALALRGTDRHRRRAPRRREARRVRVGVDLGAGAALRRDRAEPEGDPRAARRSSANLLDVGLRPHRSRYRGGGLGALGRRGRGRRRRRELVRRAPRSTATTKRPNRPADDDDGRATADADDDWLDEDDLPSGESLAEDFERYLREQGDE